MEQGQLLIPEQETEKPRASAETLPGGIASAPKPLDDSPLVAASSFEAEALRAEMLRAGRKMWERQYVDGNGGNISVRLGSKYVLCTPTMLSKGDLEPADICLSDLEGNILAGDRSRTSELLLHLEIYKANPKARAVLHCHPPYATAFAITGSAAAQRADSGVRDLRLARLQWRPMRPPAPRPLPRRCCRLSRTTTPSC